MQLYFSSKMFLLTFLLIVLLNKNDAFCTESSNFLMDSSLTSGQQKPSTGLSIKSGSDIVIYVTYMNENIKIDGVLDDPAWSRAIPYYEYFYQQEPLDRAPSSEKTKIMVLQDKEKIYFGMQIDDSEPDKIFASVMRDDGSLLNDDCIELLIDTFQDKRNSYAIGTNPLGVKVDAIISDEGNHINKSWDCIWYCKSKKNEKGWSTEMVFPFKSLKYKKGEVTDWGLNITREIKRTKEITYLAPIPRGLGHNGKFKGSLFATLKNIRAPESGLNLEIQPYTAAGRTQIYRPNDVNLKLNGGVDLKYQVTPQMTVDLTYKTDFAQVESDQEIVNVTRFNINLPEKREFFLESAGMFNFGSGTSAGGTLVGSELQPDFVFFNSRTIGIKNGKQVPLFGGAKVVGRVGKYSLGIMNLQSEETAIDNSYIEPTMNYTAMKVRKDFFTNSNVGFMVLNKQGSGNNYSRAYGSDAFFAITREIIVNGSIAKTASPDITSKDWAGTFGALLNKDWIDASVRYTHIDTLFKPDMGFVRRGNIRNASGSLGFTKWVNNDYFKSISLVNSLTYITDHHDALESRDNGIELWISTKGDDFLSLGITKEHEYLSHSEYIRNIKIDQGIYNYVNQNITFKSYRGRPITGSITYKWGDEFDGKSNRILMKNTTKVANQFNFDLEYTHDNLRFKNGSLNANVLGGRFNYSFTTELFAKYYIQWNDADKRVSGNFLIDYIYKPRSHIYLVYNENRETMYGWLHHIKDRIILLKFTYLWSV